MADGYKAVHASNKCVEMMAILCCERQLREVVKYLMNFSFYTLKENLFRDIGDVEKCALITSISGTAGALAEQTSINGLESYEFLEIHICKLLG
ncbi:hypothetical protein T09_10164 [Trichinella sp. T9]|nr:hypothetical protein T09_10164 [Trichinella sp. T9]